MATLKPSCPGCMSVADRYTIGNDTAVGTPSPPSRRGSLVKSHPFKASDGLYLGTPTIVPNRNFCLIVANRGKAVLHPHTHLDNMITDKESVAEGADQTMPRSVDGNNERMAADGGRVPVLIIAKLCGVIESQTPIGYEDEKGFHYGADLADWFFSI
jgi:hypothetical protein